MKKILLSLLLLSTNAFAATTVGLTGTILNSDGSVVNGKLKIQVVKQGINNTCSTPHRVVQRLVASIAVVNGVVQGGSVAIPVNACLSPTVPYFVQVADLSGKTIYESNWYLPNSTDSTVDVGNLTPVLFASPPVSVSIPKAIIQNPSATQTITQPNGTSLLIDSPAHTASLGINGDTPMSANPRMIWSGFSPISFGSANGSWGDVTWEKSPTIVSIHVTATTAPVGCSTSPKFGILGSSAEVALPNGSLVARIDSLAVTLGSGGTFSLGQTNTPVGCSTNPVNITIDVQYKMN